MNISELLEKIQLTSDEDVKLYFITRVLKKGVSKKALAKDKFIFTVYQIDCDSEVRSYLFNASVDQLSKTISKEYELVDYDIISDDSEHLFTYTIQNKVFSFNDVVTNQLAKTAPKVTSITDLTSTEELWAYCVEFKNPETDEKVYTFRKILPSKVCIDEKSSKGFRSWFDPKTQQLSLFKQETINLDDQIDCVFHNDIFYILKKSCFEQLVGLQEEFKERALEIVDEMIESGNVIVGDDLKTLIEQKSSIHKKLIKVEKLGNYKDLSSKKIDSMRNVAQKYGDTLPVIDNKLYAENEAGLDVILKAFCDYYKVGEISGKSYGTFSGKVLNPVE